MERGRGREEGREGKNERGKVRQGERGESGEVSD